MKNIILPALGVLLLLAVTLFSMRKQLGALFRGDLFSDPKMRELLDREKRRMEGDKPPPDAP